jgi:outer membrane protein OmpA-like peptidoglycan-associated protein
MAHFALKRTAGALGACVLAIGLNACGSSAPTRELADARRAYDNAEDGPAKTQRPGELHSAKAALDRAERAHKDDPGSDREKRLAQVAKHKADIADARGEAYQSELAAQAQRERANREAQQLRGPDDRANMAKVERDRAKDEVVVNDQPRAARSAANRETAVPAGERAGDRADDRADAALQRLTRVSKVHEDDRGVVITLSGSLLYPSGEDELSPVAKQHLDDVAAALKEQPKDRKFKVEGYSDATGSAARNKQLSTKRAQAVADYLSSHGIDKDRIEVSGYGEQNPIADNTTDEGRATNRRVEVVIAK